MKIALYDDGKLGLVQDGLVHDVSAALAALPANDRPWLAEHGEAFAGGGLRALVGSRIGARVDGVHGVVQFGKTRGKMLEMRIFQLEAAKQVGLIGVEVVQALGNVAHHLLLSCQDGSGPGPGR